MNLLRRLVIGEEGQGMIEYVIIAAFISIVAIAAIKLVSPKVQNTWTNVEDGLNPL